MTPIKKSYLGTIHGSLTVLSEPDTSDKRNVTVKVSCICGKELTVRFFGLLNKTVTNCGCLKEKWTGKVINNFTILSEPFLVQNNSHTTSTIDVRCICGKELTYRNFHEFKKGNVKHCGCLKEVRTTSYLNKKYGNFIIRSEPFVPEYERNKRIKYVNVECCCSKVYTTRLYGITSLRVKSCGCLAKSPEVVARKKAGLSVVMSFPVNTKVGEYCIIKSFCKEKNFHYKKFYHVVNDNGDLFVKSHDELCSYTSYLKNISNLPPIL